MITELEFFYNTLPPTSNLLYIWSKRNFPALTTKGSNFKKGLAAFLTDNYLHDFNNFVRGNDYVYKITMELRLPSINAGFATGKAETLYKKHDLDNRFKLLFDTLKVFLDDDCKFFEIASRKVHKTSEDDIGVFVKMEAKSPLEYGVPLELLR